MEKETIMITRLKELFNDKGPLITFSQLKDAQAPFFEIFDNEKLIKVRAIHLSSFNNLLFENIGKKGGVYKLHSHDCKEICTIYAGSVRFKSRGNVQVLNAGDSIQYNPLVPHEAEWLEDGAMFVEFVKVY